jgi:V/A-type H+-transporting ATPase subunit I
MRLHPAEARWFETFTTRDDTVHAVEALARTGVVQLEIDPRHSDSTDTAKLRHFVDRFEALAAPLAGILPNPSQRAATLIGDPVHIANQAVHRLRLWLARYEYLEERLAQVRAEHDELLLMAECVEAMRVAGLDFDGIFKPTRFLCKCLFACPRSLILDAIPSSAVEAVVKGPQHEFLYIAAAPELRDIIRTMVVEHGCSQFGVPHWLAGDHGLQQRRIVERLDRNVAELQSLEAEVHALRRAPDMGEAQANIQTLRWFLDHAPGLLARHELCHVTGWCTSADPNCLQAALHAAGIEAIVRFPEAPARSTAPVDLLSNWWARPFRPFLQLWGVPGRAEIDPSGLLPLIVPLLFGYMFPDVGHGLILALAAALAVRRWPQAGFLVPCGLSAMVFGTIFGEAFGFENLFPPLWTRPLDSPVEVILAPMGFGIGLMLLGMAFAGIEARWRGELGAWLRVEAAVVVLYVSLLGAQLWSPIYWLSGAALVHYLAGSLSLAAAGQRWQALGSAIGRLLLNVFELAMNTLSFVRVGAFALAHAALSHAILTLADMAANPWLWGLVILIGTVFSIVMEGMLTYVQTTRLVLFEFFIQFLHTEGRLFRTTRPPGDPNHQ